MLPEGWVYIPVTAKYRGTDGSIPTGSVHLYTDQVVSGEGVTVVPRSFVADINSGDGSISLEVPAPNYPDINQTTIYYHVVERFAGGREPWLLKLTPTSDPVDLTVALPAVTPPELVDALSASIIQQGAYQASRAKGFADQASGSATAAQQSATSAGVDAGTATSQAGIATGAASTATTKAGEASGSASAASSYATTATTQAGIATTKAGEAHDDAASAHDDALAAAGSASAASGSATAAATSAGNALTSENNAHDWATQAGQMVSGVLHYMGDLDASAGAWPADPTIGDLWTISVTGTIGGTTLGIGDQVFYTGTKWDKVDNAKAVLGAQWYYGSGAPTTVPDAIEGDFYVDLASSKVYQLSNVP